MKAVHKSKMVSKTKKVGTLDKGKKAIKKSSMKLEKGKKTTRF